MAKIEQTSVVAASAGRTTLVTALAACVLLLAPPARAQSSERALAQSLFEEAVVLLRERRYAEACPKLAESQRLDPAGGTLLNLAICLEKEGKLASAYVAYDETLARAIHDGNTERRQIAETRIAALRPRLAKLVVRVSEEARAVPQLEIRLDGVPLREQAWAVPFFADVGSHVITAQAPGRRPARIAIEAVLGVEARVDVPVLAPEPALPSGEPAAAAGVAKPADPADPMHARPGPLRWILGGAGLVLLGTGTAAGVLAFDRHDDAERQCPAGRCTSAGVEAEDEAGRFAWVANVTLPLGALAIAASAYLFLKAGSRSPRTSILSSHSGYVLVHRF